MLLLPSIALHTDLYQLTMAQGYWILGMHTRSAVFDLFFRENPFKGGYAVACGLESVVDLVEKYGFKSQDIEYLASLKAFDGTALFQSDFLDALLNLQLTVDVDAIEEGTVVFPKEPLLRVQGPIWQCQLLETALLNLVNFATLIATKAARVCYAAKDPVIEFGLRRAQGPDGGLTASRAAFVGGVEFTSNVLAGQQFGIPVRGTHAHSWIMAFDTELGAFQAYASALPNNCVFLVDTYRTREGVQHAIEVGKTLGDRFLGLRLDSGDIAGLSIEARQLLDQAGFKQTKILASSDLDKYEIERLKKMGAKVDLWGVGTRLVTGYDQPALGGVYKLVSIQDEQGRWRHKAKRTDDLTKKTMPGIHGVRRYSKNGIFQRDVLYLIDPEISVLGSTSISASTSSSALVLPASGEQEELLQPIFRNGKRVYQLPALTDIQERTKSQLQKLPISLRELKPNVQYSVEYKK